jgi:hypothetical protein
MRGLTIIAHREWSTISAELPCGRVKWMLSASGGGRRNGLIGAGLSDGAREVRHGIDLHILVNVNWTDQSLKSVKGPANRVEV